jgi:hypothetical protein
MKPHPVPSRERLVADYQTRTVTEVAQVVRGWAEHSMELVVEVPNPSPAFRPAQDTEGAVMAIDFDDAEYTWPPGELLSPAAQVELEAKLGTHWTGCWSYGPRHYRCALDEIRRLQQQLDELRAVANRGPRPL